ncbi:hypothetical protein BXZ70DRAFT_940771 [Cristinia sonorae]|uniref:Uncharacterized protein n=1 Tax=Cristinia sonorae TaxID=1940300 RepID=A0A8K0UN54_9AGAR|nr:hypothetical protein BXZ70DRAFT_940771 [Cristinia sonorae]
MLNLSNLRKLLSQVISPSLFAAVLFTPEGQLVSYAAGPYVSKDEVRVIVGLGGELWQESREEGAGQLDSELGHLLVVPLESPASDEAEGFTDKDDDPLMLLALNADRSLSWKELKDIASELAVHLEKPVAELRGRLSAAPTSPIRPERAR